MVNCTRTWSAFSTQRLSAIAYPMRRPARPYAFDSVRVWTVLCIRCHRPISGQKSMYASSSSSTVSAGSLWRNSRMSEGRNTCPVGLSGFARYTAAALCSVAALARASRSGMISSSSSLYGTSTTSAPSPLAK
eukprot:307054-Rhodomonas_salina.1